VLAGAGMAGAVVLGALALLSQSRGVAVAALTSAIAVLAVVPGRERRAWALVLVGAALAAAGPALLEIYRQAADGGLRGAAVRDAARAALVAAAAAGAVWALSTAAGARLLRAAPRARHGSTAALVAIVLLGAGVGVAHLRTVADTLQRQYTAFVHLDEQGPAAPSTGASMRLVAGAGNRYDYWRVAWRTWRKHPVAGIGAGNFDEAWFAERSIVEDVRQPHSLELQLLSELGLLGFLCFLALVVAGGWGAWRAARRAEMSPSATPLAVAAIGIFVAWLMHTSVDWIHLLPGVTAVALTALVTLVVEPDREPRTAGSARNAAVVRLAIPAVVTGVVLAVAAVSLAREAMAEHFRREAQASLASDPAAALRDADRSLRLDREAVETYYVKAAALARFDQGDAARWTLLAAAARERRAFVTWALLGDLSVRMRRIAEARRYYRRAVLLNPRDESLRRLADNPEKIRVP
jgi:tetratricopeptide (TPR) repeat protein